MKARQPARTPSGHGANAGFDRSGEMTHTATSGAAVPERPAMVRQGDVLLVPDEHP
jgi:hypothetical protein